MNPSVCPIKRFGTAQEFKASITTDDSLMSGPIPGDPGNLLGGTQEDGWWGIYHAMKGQAGEGGDTIFTPLCGGPPDTDGFVETKYTFRQNAAVHIVLVTDEPATFSLRQAGEGAFRTENLDDMLAVLRQGSLLDANGLSNHISDAVVTAIVPALFTIPGITEPIWGVDADVFDRRDIDAEYIIPGSITYDHQAHVFKQSGTGVTVETINTDFLKFYDNQNGTLVTAEAHYQNDILRILSDPSFKYLGDFVPGQPVNHIAQRHFFSERYAFLAWETGGTVWNVDFAIGPLRHPNLTLWQPDEIRRMPNPEAVFGPDGEFRSGTETAGFKAAVIDDIFEKLKLQIADFTDDGRITYDDVDLLYAKAALANPDPATLSRFDLDRDGDIDLAFTHNNAQADSDLELLVRWNLWLWLGDANVDAVFDSGDLVRVGQVGEYEDAFNDNSTWSEGDWNGDRDFDSSDYIGPFQEGGNEQGFRPGYLPVWGNYFPTWGTYV